MSNETFLISIKQNNDLTAIATDELRIDCMNHPLNQRKYIQMASLPGNAAKYGVKHTETKVGPLLNKNIFFLGSSVTWGYGALGESIVDYLWKADGILGTKDTENGTTLSGKKTWLNGQKGSDEDYISYIARLQANLSDKDVKKYSPDVFVLQLSTNDATKNKPLGQIASDDNFDTETITGAIEYIVSSVQKVWQCPILLFTNPYFDNDLYAKMVQRAHELAPKYHFELLDLFNNPDFQKQNSLYMADPIHPTRAGYQQKWLPLFEEKLTKILQ